MAITKSKHLSMENPTDKSNMRDAVIMIAVTLILLSVVAYLTDISLLIPFLIFIFGVHLFFYKKIKARTYVHFISLLVIHTVMAAVMMSSKSATIYFIPMAAVPMIVVLLWSDLQLALLMAFLSGAVTGLQWGMSLSDMLVFFMSSMVGVYKVKDARTRGILLEAAVWIVLIQIVGFVLVHPPLDMNLIMNVLKPSLLGGFLSVFIVMASLKIFESLFGEISQFSLLELSDTSHPLLKQLLTQAPGSYHHSMIVSNLAEAAADEIGANSLLTRVGAYYHDIGKSVKPQYFTENQQSDNKHDDLEPSMSRLVILNHVKEGVELAKQYKLHPKLIDFIPEHHGTSLIHFFYQKALAEAQEENIDENNFRYAGPKPQSKETAIVMLADSAEGATRSLGEYTPQRISDVVRKVINNKFIDGQLDECHLTLREIERIATAFTRVLSAMYHSRVKYPD